MSCAGSSGKEGGRRRQQGEIKADCDHGPIVVGLTSLSCLKVERKKEKKGVGVLDGWEEELGMGCNHGNA